MQLQTNVGILIAFLDNDFFVSHIRLNGKPTSLGSPYRGSSLSLLVATMNAVCDPSRLEIASIDSMKGLENLMKDNTFYYGKCIVYHGVSESGDLYGAMVTHKNATIPWK